MKQPASTDELPVAGNETAVQAGAGGLGAKADAPPLPQQQDPEPPPPPPPPTFPATMESSGSGPKVRTRGWLPDDAREAKDGKDAADGGPRRPVIPCADCSMTFTNMVQLKRHKQSGACTESNMVAATPSSIMLPPFVYNFEADGVTAPIDTLALATLAVDGIHHSAGGLGSLGVFFLKLSGAGNNGVIVLKQGARQSAGEFFCSLLYRGVGVPTPTMRVLSNQQLKVVAGSVGACPCTSPGAADKLQYHTGNGAVLMEYSPGCTLKHPSVPPALGDAVSAGPILRGFGSVIAVDVMINNFDRAPFVWSHEGNANNIIIRIDGAESRVVAIDQYSTAITNPDGLEAYLTKVRESTAEALAGNTSGEYITRYGRMHLHVCLWESACVGGSQTA